MTDYFGRVYELRIGLGPNNDRVFDGFPRAGHQPLQIEFTIDQTPNAERSYGEITVYGLSKESREQIYEQFSTVSLLAGYSDWNGNIFEGQIENIEIGRNGPDTFIRLYCQSGSERWRDARVSRSWGEGTPYRQIITETAETFGFPVETIGNFDELPRALKGKTFSRTTRSALLSLSRSLEDQTGGGFEWMVKNGTLYLVRDGAVTQAPVIDYKPTNGLIGSPEITDQGVNIEVLLNPFIQPWDRYTVESETGRLSVGGVYYQDREFPRTVGESTNRVISLTHEGDFYGDTWQTSLEGNRYDIV